MAWESPTQLSPYQHFQEDLCKKMTPQEHKTTCWELLQKLSIISTLICLLQSLSRKCRKRQQKSFALGFATWCLYAFYSDYLITHIKGLPWYICITQQTSQWRCQETNPSLLWYLQLLEHISSSNPNTTLTACSCMSATLKWHSLKFEQLIKQTGWLLVCDDWFRTCDTCTIYKNLTVHRGMWETWELAVSHRNVEGSNLLYWLMWSLLNTLSHLAHPFL